MLLQVGYFLFFATCTTCKLEIEIYGACCAIHSGIEKKTMMMTMHSQWRLKMACGIDHRRVFKALKHPSNEGWRKYQKSEIRYLLQGKGLYIVRWIVSRPSRG